VDLEAPTFDDTVLPVAVAGAAPLNIDQQGALDTTLAALDYSLILGMPGTGKTFVICRVVQALVAMVRNPFCSLRPC
jgi:DNA replication ATP-dependent helicase Dna2